MKINRDLWNQIIIVAIAILVIVALVALQVFGPSAEFVRHMRGTG